MLPNARWFVAVFLVISSGVAAWAETGRLYVTGHGTVEVAPDMATITMGVTHQADTADAALAATSSATGELLTLLSEIGIEPRDMQTNNLHLSPLWENNREGAQKISGYRASNNVVMRVRVLGDLGVILDDVVANGANQFHGLSFGIQEPGPHSDLARGLAVADARRTAAMLADAAGMALGPVVEIRYGAAPVSVAAAQFAARAEAVPIAGGELSVTAQVSVVYELLEN